MSNISKYEPYIYMSNTSKYESYFYESYEQILFLFLRVLYVNVIYMCVSECSIDDVASVNMFTCICILQLFIWVNIRPI